MRYAAYTDVIWSIAATPAQARREAGTADAAVAAVTPALAALVDDRGGAVPFRRLAGGTLGTLDEELAQDAAAAERSASVEAAVSLSLARSSDCADWIDLRERMLREMARHLDSGQVVLSTRGLLHWRAGSLIHDERSGRSGRLATDPRRAAREMEANLGQPGWTADLDRQDRERVAARARRMAEIGTALFGPEWVSPMARHLGVGLRTVQRWAAAEIDVPAGVTGDLSALVGRLGPQRTNELRRWIAVLELAG